MAQHDYIIANQSGAAFRADLNNNLAAIVSQNSGAAAPSTTYAYQWWADTTTGLLKIRNAANSAWITIGTLADANLGLLSLAGGTLTGALLADDAGTAALPAIAFDGDPNTGIFRAGADQVAVATNGTQRLTVSTAATTSTLPVVHPLGAVGTPSITFTGDLNTGIWSPAADTIAFSEGGVEAMRIDSSGRLLVGTSTSAATLAGLGPILQVSESGGVAAALLRSSNDTSGANLVFRKTRATSSAGVTVVQNGDTLGRLVWMGTDGTNPQEAARIDVAVDGTPGTNDMPARLVFFTTADGGITPAERMRISQDGQILVNQTASVGARLGVNVTTNEIGTKIDSSYSGNILSFHNSTNGSFVGTLLKQHTYRAATSAYEFIACDSNHAATPDREYTIRGDGNAFADGTWSGGGADYAEFFEWSDSNPNEEDRRGISVVLDGDKIREAVAGEDPIGVISGNPSVVGDAAWNKWSGKYLRDEFGTYIQEDYEVVNDEGETVVQQRRKLNPTYDPDQEYIPREQRPEWDCVGLMGKLRIRKGQVTGSRWIKMSDISDSVEEWLVR